MTDRRQWPANDRVAAESLRGQVTDRRFAVGEVMRITRPVADLRRNPDGPRDRQLCYGETVTCYESRAGACFVQATRDGYVGYLEEAALAPCAAPASHRVIARATHLYAAADFRSADRCTLSLGSLVTALGTEGRFTRTADGFLPTVHLAPIDPPDSDPVAVAERLLGTPYLWGGNSSFGIDCSGLVQIGCRAAALPCPGDSDQQMAEIGHELPADTPLRRGDLVFWKGHVAWCAAPDRLLHANAHHMAVTYEPLAQAIARIEAQGEGRPLCMKRLPTA